MGARHSGHRPPSALRSFLSSETAGGAMLMAAAATALIVANSPWGAVYERLLHMRVGELDLLHWTDDGLMALFFLLVGLEVKREVLDGQLSTWSARLLPGVAALGGMAVPAVIYLAVNAGDPAAMRGWAIPSATDIAFALGILSLLGRRVPVSLKVFLTALAIIDDLGAVLIIALFYTHDLQWPALAAAGGVLAVLVALNRLKVGSLWPYMALGAVLWWFVFRSGVHPTLAGVATALTVPLRRSPARPDDEASPLHRLEHFLQPWVAFVVLPIFGFANAGVSFAGVTLATLAERVPLGVALGLFLGKQIGVFLPSWLLVRSGVVDMPAHANLRQLYGISVLCGVGFTMSLFIGFLAFPDPAAETLVKLGVLTGSLASGVFGYALLRTLQARR